MSGLHLELTRREVYGVVKWYPANDAARALAKIAGTKTLTEEVLAVAMQELRATVGFTKTRAPFALTQEAA
ncbi:MAG: hypothetical protein RL684_1969 [Pseudomonadota bacterium]